MILQWKVFLIAAFVLGSGAAVAQVPGMYPWWDGPVARDLGLTDEQNKQIRATVRESRDRLIRLRGAVEAAEAELKDEMNEDKVDHRKAEQAIEKVVTARIELARAVSQMSLKLRLILTSAQWQELQKRESRPGPPSAPLRGPGMGGGPGRPPHRDPDRGGSDPSGAFPERPPILPPF